MRYPAQHKQATRERIVRAAARRFRTRGADGAGIAALMRDLHLTHGGFYRHFPNKDALFDEALQLGFVEISDYLEAAAKDAAPGEALKAIIDAYLGPKHCDNPGTGCPLAAHTAEVARRPRLSRTAFERVLRSQVKRLAKHVPGRTEEERQLKTAVLFSGMAGTLSLARTITDDQLRQRVLDDARSFFVKAVTA
jgi:TetR/AcrR family transcriptional repressor of nem operon